MDPNHWNTYNLQYGHSASTGLPTTHPSLTRLDLTSGLGLSHTLQTGHGPLGGRSVSAIPAVSYQGLGVPILDPLTAGISATQTHKTMSLAPGQLVFEPPVRVSEQQSPTIRYDGSKSFRADGLHREGMTRTQFLEAAFASTSLYNQFGSVLSDVAATSAATMSPSPGTGVSSLVIGSKSNQQHMHDPPPAHSSSSVRLNSIQRNPHTADILYARGTDTLIPSSLAQISSLYSTVTFGKQGLTSNQQQILHRQTPINIQQSFSSNSDIEDLSSNSQSQLYGSYANISVADAQDFPSAQLTGDISYEAVSPAPSMNESTHHNQEHTSFSIVQFPELVHLTPEHAHTLADKFQENDFRLKLDSRIQQHQQGALASSHQSQRQEVGAALKVPKEMSNFQTSMLSMQVSHRSSQFQPSITVSQALNPSISHIHSGTVSISQPSPLLQPHSLSTMSMSMQQTPAPISVQAPADSTTKPKRSRSRKKKGEINAQSAIGQVEENKKSSPTQTFSAVSQQQAHMSHQPPILSMPLTSQHISTLPMASHVSHNSPAQQQQNFRSPSSNQFTTRNPQRPQTPSMHQTYSTHDQQSQGYASASPKISHQNVIRSPGEFVLPNDKSTTSSSSSPFKQQKKSLQVTQKGTNSQMFRSNIPDSQQQIQNFASHTVLMGNTGQQRNSPMQDGRSSSMSRMQSFDNSSQQKLICHMSPISQPSPQGSAGTDNGGYNSNKMSSSSHMMGSALLVSQPSVSLSQSPMGSRPVSVEPTAMTHAYEQGHPSGLIDPQESGHFQIDFTGQPFLEQLVGVQPPMVMPSTSYSHTNIENGEVVFTTLVTPAESAHLQQHDSTSSETFRPTYHGEPVHEIQPIGSIGNHLGMEDFFDNQREMDQQGGIFLGQQATPEPEKMTLTFMPHITEDDELGHFSQMSQAVLMVKKEPQEPGTKTTSKDSFQDSFLSYLQGHKQETLSSVSSSAVTKKPQLPKYIPEPRRPRAPAHHQHMKDSLNFSDAEDSMSAVSGRVRDLISSLSDNDNSSQKSESDREGYSVQRTSELAVKITLPKHKNKSKFGPFAEMTQLKDKSFNRDRDGLLKRKRKRGKRHGSEEDEYMPGHISDEAAALQGKESSREASPPPKRTSIGRKAKDKCLEKTKKHGKLSDSDSSSEEPFHPVGKGTFKNDDTEKDYDSDKDPVWMPFDMDLKQGHDFDEKRKKTKRPRTRTPNTKSVKSLMGHKITLSPSINSDSNSQKPLHTAAPPGDSSIVTSATSGDNLFKPGMYVIEKKDLQNYDNYPVWRLEPGSMMRKFEMKIDGDSGSIRHQAVGTFSTWMPSMETQFVPIKVHHIPMTLKGDPVTVEVLEEYRPKPPMDGRLELQYEDDPLVEPFSIYLQVFLSQALEPTFLSAVLKTNEKFYVDVLNQIDGLIESKCQEITRLAHWKLSFQDFLEKCPLMREIDRPNLKQACQASENSSPPTIKSVLLSGHPYDRYLLTEKSSGGADIAQEFMIGKVAAFYVRPYHSLYHFKYWLRQRCEAKVKMMKESNKAENPSDEIILDKCLENRSWVLQLFDSLKGLLKYGENTAAR